MQERGQARLPNLRAFQSLFKAQPWMALRSGRRACPGLNVILELSDSLARTNTEHTQQQASDDSETRPF